MAKKNSRTKKTRGYQDVLTAIALFVAMTGLAYSLFTASPEKLAQDATRLLASGAAATLGVAVPENQYNTLAEQLRAKQTELDQREASLNAAPARPATWPLFQSDLLSVASFFMSFILLILIGLNFYFDKRRVASRTPVGGKYSVDLR